MNTPVIIHVCRIEICSFVYLTYIFLEMICSSVKQSVSLVFSAINTCFEHILTKIDCLSSLSSAQPCQIIMWQYNTLSPHDISKIKFHDLLLILLFFNGSCKFITSNLQTDHHVVQDIDWLVILWLSATQPLTINFAAVVRATTS